MRNIAGSLAAPLVGAIGSSLAKGGNFLPTMIGDTELWLAADRNIDVTGGLVDSWNDLSGNGNDCTGSGGGRPTLIADQIGGKPAVVFDGSATFLTMPSALYSIPNGSFTIYHVSVRDAPETSVDAAYGFSQTGTNTTFLTFNSTAGNVSFKSRLAAGGSLISTGHTNTQYNIIRNRRDGTTLAVSFNGSAEDTSATGADVSGVDSARIGSSGIGTFFLDGGIAEFIIYSKSLSTAEQLLVESYLSNKYNIALV